MAVEKIVYRRKVFALIVRRKNDQKGVEFFTPDDFSLQVGKHRYPKGKIIKPHRHCPVRIERFASLQEVLFIESGAVKVIFYDDESIRLTSKMLNKGDLIFLREGGHGFEFLKPTKMLEIKEGPYLPESKKSLEVKKKR